MLTIDDLSLISECARIYYSPLEPGRNLIMKMAERDELEASANHKPNEYPCLGTLLGLFHDAPTARNASFDTEPLDPQNNTEISRREGMFFGFMLGISGIIGGGGMVACLPGIQQDLMEHKRKLEGLKQQKQAGNFGPLEKVEEQNLKQQLNHDYTRLAFTALAMAGSMIIGTTGQSLYRKGLQAEQRIEGLARQRRLNERQKDTLQQKALKNPDQLSDMEQRHLRIIEELDIAIPVFNRVIDEVQQQHTSQPSSPTR